MYNSSGFPQKRKSFYRRLQWGKRQAVALREQHQLRPFTHEAVLSFAVDVDMKRFRSRLSRFVRGRFDVVWFSEVAKGSTRQHFHLIMRTFCSKSNFEELLCDCLATRKGKDVDVVRSMFNLHWQEIVEGKEIGLFLYSTKATKRTLLQNELQQLGKRETFQTGKPFDRAKRQLVSSPSRRMAKILMLIAENADIVVAVMDGRLPCAELWGRTFQWKYHHGFYKSIGLMREN